MTNDQDKTVANSDANDQNEKKGETPLAFHNPLDPNDTRKITQEDLDNEQQFKEAITERD